MNDNVKNIKEIVMKVLYSEDHEWLEIDESVSPPIARIGITDHAQKALGELVFVELPAINAKVDAGESTAVVESIKAASDVYAPISGTIISVNNLVENNPSLINSDPENNGWLWTMSIDNADELSKLLLKEDYDALIST